MAATKNFSLSLSAVLLFGSFPGVLSSLCQFRLLSQKHHTWVAYRQQKFLPHCSESEKVKVKVPAQLGSTEIPFLGGSQGASSSLGRPTTER